IEGMILAGLAVGADHGILFIRHEYEAERHAFERALHEANAQGLLGANILGSGFDFDLEVFVSPGGYILGGGAALRECLEVKRGVYEIAVGTTVGELIEQAGGMKNGRSLLTFTPGGASSSFLPASAIDTPLDFTATAKAGSMLGSGALFVVAEGTDLLALAANIVRFCHNESCGKCVPRRLGTPHSAPLWA